MAANTDETGAPSPAASRADFAGETDEEARLTAQLERLRAAKSGGGIPAAPQGASGPRTEPPAEDTTFKNVAGNADNTELVKLLRKMQKRMDELEAGQAATAGGAAKAPPYTHWVRGFEERADIVEPGQPGYPEKDPPKDADGNLVPFMATGMHRS